MNPYNLYPNHPAIGIKIKIYAFFYLLCMGNSLFLNPDIQGINLFVIFNLHNASLFILINGCYYSYFITLLMKSHFEIFLTYMLERILSTEALAKVSAKPV